MRHTVIIPGDDHKQRIHTGVSQPNARPLGRVPVFDVPERLQPRPEHGLRGSFCHTAHRVGAENPDMAPNQGVLSWPTVWVPRTVHALERGLRSRQVLWPTTCTLRATDHLSEDCRCNPGPTLL